MLYDEIIFEIKNDYTNLWEYVENNIKKYDDKKWKNLFEMLLHSIYDVIFVQGDDWFTWEGIFESFVTNIKKNKIEKKQELIDLFSVYDNVEIKEYYNLIMTNIKNGNYYMDEQYALMFEFLYLSMICECAKMEIKLINDKFVSCIHNDIEVI